MPTPHYPIKRIKALLREKKFRINGNALESALDDFGWGPTEIVKCLMRLNDKFHKDNPEKHHFHKKEPHRYVPNTMMDYYKIRNGFEDNSIYTHLYIHPDNGKLIINSFHVL